MQYGFGIDDGPPPFLDRWKQDFKDLARPSLTEATVVESATFNGNSHLVVTPDTACPSPVIPSLCKSKGDSLPEHGEQNYPMKKPIVMPKQVQQHCTNTDVEMLLQLDPDSNPDPDPDPVKAFFGCKGLRPPWWGTNAWRNGVGNLVASCSRIRRGLHPKKMVLLLESPADEMIDFTANDDIGLDDPPIIFPSCATDDGTIMPVAPIDKEPLFIVVSHYCQ